jgi:hypothetical protein
VIVAAVAFVDVDAAGLDPVSASISASTGDLSPRNSTKFE